jgi:hypothetical protein
LRALHVGASGRSPIMGVRPDAPTIETIVWVTFYEIIKIESSYLLTLFFSFFLDTGGEMAYQNLQ